MTIRSATALAAAALLAAAEAEALQRVRLDDGGQAAVVISRRDLNRIAVEGDGIASVWARKSQAEITPDPDGGDVFVRPRTAQALTLYVRTASGRTYTLLAMPKDVPGETILIRSGRALEARPSAAGPRQLPRLERIKRVIRAMAEGDRRYARTPLGREIPLWREARTELVEAWPGDLRGELWRLENTSGAEMRLDEREWAAVLDGVQAVAIERHVLAPGEATRVYLVRTLRRKEKETGDGDGP